MWIMWSLCGYMYPALSKINSENEWNSFQEVIIYLLPLVEAVFESSIDVILDNWWNISTDWTEDLP